VLRQSLRSELVSQIFDFSSRELAQQPSTVHESECDFRAIPSFTYGNGEFFQFNSSIFIEGKNYTLGYPLLEVIAQPELASAQYSTLPDTNHSLTTDWISANSFCRPANTYHWGFASLLLLVFCIISTLFALIILLLRWDIYWNSRAGRFKSHISIYRDAIDLVAELTRQLESKSWNSQLWSWSSALRNAEKQSPLRPTSYLCQEVLRERRVATAKLLPSDITALYHSYEHANNVDHMLAYSEDWHLPGSCCDSFSGLT
jgi:hypothetical protein